MGTTAGILLILTGIAHNYYGEKYQIPVLKTKTDDDEIIGTLRVMVYQIGILIIAVGIVQVLVGMGIIEISGVAKYFLVGIVFIIFMTFLFISIFKHQVLFKMSPAQIVIFTLIMGLQFLAL